MNFLLKTTASSFKNLAVLAAESSLRLLLKGVVMKKLSTLFTAATAASCLALSSGMAFASDIVKTAVDAGNFTTLVTAVKAAGLTDTLQGAGPFTVFAPTDAAFAALPAGTVTSLLQPENKAKLVSILTYHVLAGRVLSKDISGKKLSPKTVNGKYLSIQATDATVKVNSATVIKADIMADNGVIHVIDKVLIPE